MVEEELDLDLEIMTDVYTILTSRRLPLRDKFFTKERRKEFLDKAIEFFKEHGDEEKVVALYSILLDDELY